MEPNETLALSVAHLATADRLISGQAALIGRLVERGYDVRDAWELLVLFEDIKAQMMVHHRSLERDMRDWRAAKRQ